MKSTPQAGYKINCLLLKVVAFCCDSLRLSPNLHFRKFDTSIAAGFINTDCCVRTFHFISLLLFRCLPVLQPMYNFVDMAMYDCSCHVLMCYVCELVILFFLVFVYLFAYRLNFIHDKPQYHRIYYFIISKIFQTLCVGL